MFRKSGDRLSDKNMREIRFAAAEIPEEQEMPIDDDDRPPKKVAHEIGQDLALLSVEELNDRVAMLKAEIGRLEEALTSKRASRDAASRFFKS